MHVLQFGLVVMHWSLFIIVALRLVLESVTICEQVNHLSM